MMGAAHHTFGLRSWVFGCVPHPGARASKNTICLASKKIDTLKGNDRADELADEGSARSPLYDDLIPDDRPYNKPRYKPPSVVEERWVLSSDEELGAICHEALHKFYESGATFPPRSGAPKGSTPDRPTTSDFFRDTPDPQSDQDFPA